MRIGYGGSPLQCVTKQKSLGIGAGIIPFNHDMARMVLVPGKSVPVSKRFDRGANRGSTHPAIRFLKYVLGVNRVACKTSHKALGIPRAQRPRVAGIQLMNLQTIFRSQGPGFGRRSPTFADAAKGTTAASVVVTAASEKRRLFDAVNIAFASELMSAVKPVSPTQSGLVISHDAHRAARPHLGSVENISPQMLSLLLVYLSRNREIDRN